MSAVSEPRRLDGNAAGGLLSQIFGAEMTGARITCSTCHATWAIGQCHLYGDGPGAVLRCYACSALVLRAATTPRGSWIEVRGALVLERVG